MTKIKICGIKDKTNLGAALDAGADFIGLMFYAPSPRNISIEQAAELTSHRSANYVAVTVDADNSLLESIKTNISPAYFQLHGDESVERVAEVKSLTGAKVIKAISIADASDVERVLQYKDVADILLLDTKIKGADIKGGSGVSFDWSLLEDADLSADWMLSGGLNIENIQDALKQTSAPMIDVSSGVEGEKGVKDPALITAFIEAVKSE